MKASAQGQTAAFLQSAVVLDDQPDHLGVIEVGELKSPQARTGSSTKHAATVEERSRPDNSLDVKALSDGFADSGIVCGVLCPSNGADKDESRRLMEVAGRADIVILDWQIGDDRGETTREIISRLANAELSQNALKLVCIYTADTTSFVKIVDEVEERLKKDIGPGRASKISDFELCVDALRVVLYSKVPIELPGDSISARYAPEKELPGRLIRDFVGITSGLLQRVAIRALTTLRRNTHVLAGQFHDSIDAGYLWHRGALPEPSDAEAHVREALVSEINSIVEASDATEAAAGGECVRVISQLSEPLADRFGIADRVDYADLELVVFPEGKSSEMSKQVKRKLAQRQPPRIDIAAFSDDAAEAQKANQKFAMMLTLRTVYEGAVRGLHLGTVLRSGKNGAYRFYLCLQPHCDSGRIQTSRSFPLLPIELANPGERFNLVIPLGDSSIGYFKVKYSPYLLNMREFAADDGVEATRDADGRWTFVDKEGVEYIWLAELRPFVAQRVVSKLAQQFGRIALDLPEWIRESEE